MSARVISHKGTHAFLILRPYAATCPKGADKFPVVHGVTAEAAWLHCESVKERLDINKEGRLGHVPAVCGKLTACQRDLRDAYRYCGIDPAWPQGPMSDAGSIDGGLVRRVLADATASGQHWSQRSLSLAAGLGPDGVRNILSGRSVHPKISTLIRLAEAMGKDVSVFFQGGTRGIDASSDALPPRVSIQLEVLLPSEAALTAMFDGLLLAIGDQVSHAERAQQLAELLPIGLARIAAPSPAPARSAKPRRPKASPPSPPARREHPSSPNT